MIIATGLDPQQPVTSLNLFLHIFCSTRSRDFIPSHFVRLFSKTPKHVVTLVTELAHRTHRAEHSSVT
jgi:hypothetical protein